MPTRSKSKTKKATPAKKKAAGTSKLSKVMKTASRLLDSGQAKTRSSAMKKAWKQVA